MSNQNRKKRIRQRQRTTGTKYTEAAREQARRESLGAGALPPSSFSMAFRGQCDECGGDVKWMKLSDVEELAPDRVAEYKASGFYEASSEDSDAWICLQCNNFGVFGRPHADGFDMFDDLQDPGDFEVILNSCSACGKPVDWVDPASLAMRHRDQYMAAKNRYGAELLLQGVAAVCTSCEAIEFHPGPH